MVRRHCNDSCTLHPGDIRSEYTIVASPLEVAVNALQAVDNSRLFYLGEMITDQELPFYRSGKDLRLISRSPTILVPCRCHGDDPLEDRIEACVDHDMWDESRDFNTAVNCSLTDKSRVF